MAGGKFGKLMGEAKKAAPARGNDTKAPVGKHTATVTYQAVSKTQDGKKDKLVLKLVVDSGPYIGQTGWASHALDVENQINLRIFGKLAEIFGVSDDDLDAFDETDTAGALSAVGDAAFGKRARITVWIPQGRTETEVKYIDELSGDAAPSQLEAQKEAQKAGVANIAGAIGKPAVKKATPAKPAF